MNIIPAIDIIDGKCVRLTQGDYNRSKTYFDNPLDVAKKFEDAGIKRLHLVDLEGAKSGHIVNYKVLENIASGTKLSIDFGGGLKSDEDLDIAFSSGANQITAGSIAVKNIEKTKKWFLKYGNEKIILGSDVKDEMICINGWQEKTNMSIWNLIDEYREFLRYIICTDISKDGAMQGTSVDLYKKIMDRYPEINLIASGGVSNMNDIIELSDENIWGAITGKAIYEGELSLKEIKEYNKRKL